MLKMFKVGDLVDFESDPEINWAWRSGQITGVQYRIDGRLLDGTIEKVNPKTGAISGWDAGMLVSMYDHPNKVAIGDILPYKENKHSILNWTYDYKWEWKCRTDRIRATECWIYYTIYGQISTDQPVPVPAGQGKVYSMMPCDNKLIRKHNPGSKRRSLRLTERDQLLMTQ